VNASEVTRPVAIVKNGRSPTFEIVFVFSWLEEVCPMPESFGARLRRTREEQQIALVTIAQQTKIKLSLLEGLERDDVSHWPSAIFRRAYIRAYAQSIGLNPDVVVREFIEVHPEPEEVFETALATALAADAARASGGSRLKSMFGSALGSLSRLAAGPSTPRRDAAETPAPAMTPRPVDVREVTAQSDDEIFAFGIHPPIAMHRFEMADDAGIEPGSYGQPALPPSMVDCDRTEADFGSDEFDDIDEGAPTMQARPTASSLAGEEPASGIEEQAEIRRSYPDMLALGHLCTELGRVESAEDLNALLELSAGMLHARGLIAWVWDDAAVRLRPGLAHGYSDRVLAQLPALRPDADNATAAAFRSGQPCAIAGDERAGGALVMPLLTSSGCVGVLALELHGGVELNDWLHGLATILAAMLAQLVERSRAAVAAAEVELAGPMLRESYR
jgi:hypothetical protein